MTVSAVFRQQLATALTLKSSGGSAVITLASLANGSYRQSAKIDFGASWPQQWRVEVDFEMAATPTAGNFIDLWCNPSSSGTAGTDNKGGCSGSDGAYTGYSSNAADAIQHLVPVGSHRCSATATGTVQKSVIRVSWNPPARYCSFVLLNGSGAAFHTSDANTIITFTPIEPIAETA